MRFLSGEPNSNLGNTNPVSEALRADCFASISRPHLEQISYFGTQSLIWRIESLPRDFQALLLFNAPLSIKPGIFDCVMDIRLAGARRDAEYAKRVVQQAGHNTMPLINPPIDLGGCSIDFKW